ncbi:MAG: hypothetical protein J7498_03515 [Sphingobium sp.]|nr:hypothetical protein [Sphingobium sp.]
MRMSKSVLIAVLLLGACGTKATQGNAAAPAATTASGDGSHLPADFARLPMKEFMGHVMQNGGEGVWRWQGFVADEKGERSLFPKDDKEWEEAESGALTLAELTNLLLMPGRRIDDPKWDAAVAGVRALALKAATAAEKHDKDAFFAVGGELDEACDECHKQFIPNFVGPQSANPGAPPAKTS